MKYILHSCTIALLLTINISAQIFNAHCAGSSYPVNKKELSHLLQRMSDNAKTMFAMKTDHVQIRALIVPHAGYEYSGTVAAAVYNLVAKKQVQRIIILGPSHFVPFKGIAIPPFNRYRTLLGTLTTDAVALDSLQNKNLVLSDTHYFTPEHSIEMQLPLIQWLVPNAQIVPIVVGNLSDAEIKTVASMLKNLITKNTLVVISSDFTHYGKNFKYVPFTKDIVPHIEQLDSAVLHPIQHQECADFKAVIEKTHDTVCGYNPIRILLELINQNAFGAVTTRLVAHDTSYTITKDPSSIVSYAGLIVTNEIHNDLLNQQEETSLLSYARHTLQESFKQTIDPDLLKPIMTLLLEKPQGAFATLWTMHKGSERTLRSCIGQIYPKKPLYETVAQQVLDAAFHDPRFSPVKETELAGLQIELSVLQEPKSVKYYNDIKLHKHGIILTNGDKTALFLPTVPAEFGFTFTQTLQELSLKAGLDENAWKLPSTTFQVFEAQEFDETGL